MTDIFAHQDVNCAVRDNKIEELEAALYAALKERAGFKDAWERANEVISSMQETIDRREEKIESLERLADAISRDCNETANQRNELAAKLAKIKDERYEEEMKRSFDMGFF